MNRAELLAAMRRIALDERRHGIGYWCDPELADALRAALAPARMVKAPGSGGGSPPSDGVGRAAPGSGAARSVPGSGADRAAQPPPVRREAPAPEPVATGSGASTKAGSASKAATWGPPPQATGRVSDWATQLADLDAVVKRCRKCGLCEGRTKTVFGSGKATVPLVFVGEAPGADEDRQGLPFVGRAGELLTRIIAAMGLTRDEVYICNVLKCRPPGNRDPLPDEVGACTAHLERQLDLLKPKVICSLGRHSTAFLTGQEGVAMKSVRGRTFLYRGMKVIPTYHPAALLRNPSLKVLVWEDVQKVRALLDASGRED